MAVATQTMTNEQRKSVALEYLKAFDNAGVTSTSGSILDLFADDAQVYFPKWGIAEGRAEIGKLFGDIGQTLKSIKHDYASFNWIFSGGDTIVAEGTSYGEHQDGTWRAGVPDWGAGRWCDVFEIRDFLIQRCFIYLDPDLRRPGHRPLPLARPALSRDAASGCASRMQATRILGRRLLVRAAGWARSPSRRARLPPGVGRWLKGGSRPWSAAARRGLRRECRPRR